VSDGNSATLVADIEAGPESSQPSELFALPQLGLIVFHAFTSSYGEELWQSDGTAAGTVRISDIAPGEASSSPRVFAATPSKLYFVASDGAIGFELWGRAHSPDVSVALMAPVAKASVLSPTGLVVRVTNSGPSSASGLALAYNVSAGEIVSVSDLRCTFSGMTASCALGELSANASIEITFNVLAGSEITIDHQASLTTSSADRQVANNTALTSTVFSRSSDRSIAFVADPPGVAGLSGDVILELSVKNDGPTPDTGVSVSGPSLVGDLLLGSEDPRCGTQTGTFGCSLGALAVGAETTFTIYVSSPTERLVDAHFSVTGSNPDLVSANDQVPLKLQFRPLDTELANLGVEGRSTGCGCRSNDVDAAWLVLAVAALLRRRHEKLVC